MFGIAIVLALVLASDLPSLKIEGLPTISGLSSGGFAAVQYQVSFSSELAGAGILAAGPYYCAQSSLSTALTACTVEPLALNLDASLEETRNCVAAGECDDSRNLSNHTVWLFSGTVDFTVNPQVVQALEKYYQEFIKDESRILTKFDLAATHCFPTVRYGSFCSLFGSPFINKCDYDGAFEMLNALYGGGLREPVQPIQDNMQTFSQSPFLPSGMSAESVSVQEEGVIYVPTNCRKGSSCKLHIALHGCQQTRDVIGDAFIEHTGIINVAEANDIVVVFPQAAKSSPNPEGCWDWWGFTGPNYARKTGVQNAMIHGIQTKLMTARQ